MNYLCGIILLLLLQSNSAFAQLNSNLEKTIYSMVHKHCSSSDVNLEHSLAFVDSMKNSFNSFNEVASFNSDPAIQIYKDHGLSSTTSTILNSIALHMALQTCYGDNQALKNQYVIKMITADLLGRTLGTAQGISAFILGGKFFIYIIKNVHGALLLSPFGKKLNPANASRHMGIMTGATAIALLSPKFLELYKKRRDSQVKDSSDLNEYREILEMAHVELTRIQQTPHSFCEKSAAAYEVALIVQDTYGTLKEREDGQQLSKRFEPTYKYSLSIKPCAS